MITTPFALCLGVARALEVAHPIGQGVSNTLNNRPTICRSHQSEGGSVKHEGRQETSFRQGYMDPGVGKQRAFWKNEGFHRFSGLREPPRIVRPQPCPFKFTYGICGYQAAANGIIGRV